MEISDIITLIALVIAIVALINERNRTLLLLKFSKLDRALLLVAFLLINYFVFYKSFYIHHLYVRALFFKQLGFNNPKHWAYVITMASLGYIFFKIYHGFYPAERRTAIIDYYNRQIENGEIAYVIDLLTRYHQKDVIRYIKDGPTYDANAGLRDLWGEHSRWLARAKAIWQTRWRELVPYSWANRRSYADAVLNNVIGTHAFLALASSLRPYFFPRIFREFRQVNRDRFSDEIINPYLKQLLIQRNFWLEKELKACTDNAPTQPEWFFSDNPLLAALWLDLSVAEVNEVWRPFGEAALAELRAERAKGRSSVLFQKNSGETDLWKYTTFWSIQFFYAMINQAMVMKYTESHFWLYYYDRIIEAIMETLDQFPSIGHSDKGTVYHELADEVKVNIFAWLQGSNKKEHPGLFHNILDCIGTCIYQVSGSVQYGEEQILAWLNSLFYYYCHLDENAYTDELRTKYEEIINRPSLLIESGHPYYAYLREAWKKFDKIPYRSPGGRSQEYPYFTRLKKRVVMPLKLQ